MKREFMMEGDKRPPKPFILEVLPTVVAKPTIPKVVIKVPAPFPYSSNHAVPWNYGVKVETVPVAPENKELAEEFSGVTNVNNAGGFTRSGRYYQPKDVEKLRKDKGKTMAEETLKDIEKELESENKIEDEEFLKVMKHSEYNIVDQLKKTPARISLLSLILNSEAHRKALQKFLDQSYVCPNISVENFGNVVNAIRKMGTISFTEDELVPGPSNHTRPLHIALKCAGCILSKVLIDNGSALNVLPTTTLLEMQVDPSLIQSSNTVVRAFDGTRREVTGDITLTLEIGPNRFNVNFQVMDIEPAYTMLLGRPWIHDAGAVPSTLHQKLKYIDDGKVITVRGEEELLVTKPSSLPYVEVTEQALETSFQAMELESGNMSQKAISMMKKQGFQQGRGLGANLQGISTPISLPENVGRQGLGYSGSNEREEKNRFKRVEIPYMRGIGTVASEIITSSEEEEPTPELSIVGVCSKMSSGIRLCKEDEELTNWEMEPFQELIYFE